MRGRFAASHQPSAFSRQPSGRPAQRRLAARFFHRGYPSPPGVIFENKGFSGTIFDSKGLTGKILKTWGLTWGRAESCRFLGRSGVSLSKSKRGRRNRRRRFRCYRFRIIVH